MIVNGNLAFICVPRTASRSISSALLDVPSSHAIRPHHTVEVPARCSELVAVVRDPFDRMKGTWWNYQRRKLRASPRFATFGAFLDWCGASNPHMVCPVSEFLPHRVISLLRYEDIQNNRLPATAPGILAGLELPAIGQSNAPVPESSEYLETIAQRHRVDFEQYNYEPCVAV